MKKNEPVLDKAEIAYLKAGLKRAFKERFEYATMLYKTHLAMNKIMVSHKVLLPNKHHWLS